MATDKAVHVDPVERLKEEHKAWKHHHPQVCSFRMELLFSLSTVNFDIVYSETNIFPVRAFRISLLSP